MQDSDGDKRELAHSVSSVESVTEVHHGTILKLLIIGGEKCERIMGEKVRNVPVRDVEADEVWSFVSWDSGASVTIAFGCLILLAGTQRGPPERHRSL